MKSKLFILYSFLFFFISTDVDAKQNQLKKETIFWQNISRSYLLYVPQNYNGNKPVSLLFHLHGGGGTAKGTIKLTFGKFNQLAEEKGFIMVYPNALKKNWNDGRMSNMKPGMEFVDDVGFILEIIKNIKTKYNIDSQRIYVTGMSNGGFMTSRLLCDASEIFRGGAILTATLSEDYLDRCKPTTPLGVMIINGTADPLVPYNGGQVMVFKKERGKILSTDDFIYFWKKQMDCKEFETFEIPDIDINDSSTVAITQFSNCNKKSTLTLYKIIGGGHSWPGGKQYLPKKIIGFTNKDFNACEIIWDFFENLPEKD